MVEIFHEDTGQSANVNIYILPSRQNAVLQNITSEYTGIKDSYLNGNTYGVSVLGSSTRQFNFSSTHQTSRNSAIVKDMENGGEKVEITCQLSETSNIASLGIINENAPGTYYETSSDVYKCETHPNCEVESTNSCLYAKDPPIKAVILVVNIIQKILRPVYADLVKQNILVI